MRAVANFHDAYRDYLAVARNGIPEYSVNGCSADVYIPGNDPDESGTLIEVKSVQGRGSFADAFDQLGFRYNNKLNAETELVLIVPPYRNEHGRRSDNRRNAMALIDEYRERILHQVDGWSVVTGHPLPPYSNPQLDEWLGLYADTGWMCDEMRSHVRKLALVRNCAVPSSITAIQQLDRMVGNYHRVCSILVGVCQ